MTAVWHVDDLKISNKHPWEVSKIALWLSKIDHDIKVQLGRKVVYLGMDLGCSLPSHVKISMVPYINDIITSFLEDITGVSTTPAVHYLFEVKHSKDATKLPNEQAIAFHYYFTKLLSSANMQDVILKHQ